MLGLYWSLGGAGYPFGENDPKGARISLLAGFQRQFDAASAARRWGR
jgi:hypothetical protein